MSFTDTRRDAARAQRDAFQVPGQVTPKGAATPVSTRVVVHRQLRNSASDTNPKEVRRYINQMLPRITVFRLGDPDDIATLAMGDVVELLETGERFKVDSVEFADEFRTRAFVTAMKT